MAHQAERAAGPAAAFPAADLAALEARLQGILDPYRDRLEPFEIYGMPMLRRPGARAHDWFAGVRSGFGAVKFSLLPMHAHPEVLEGVSPGLLKRKTGASVFMFRPGDDDLVPELECVVARAFATYMRDSTAT
jgi:hypothetical protein